MQLDFFGERRRTLVDDATGRIAYEPGCVALAQAETWFAILRDGTPWRTERRQMYDREVDVPRLVASYRLDEDDVPEVVAAAAAVGTRVAGAPFNSVGLNYYRDGRDSVAPHNDHLDEIVPGKPIALLSLGAVRRMTIRSKRPPKHVLDIDLEPGSLLIMSYETQMHYDHGIPKVRAAAGGRISIAMRVRPR